MRTKKIIFNICKQIQTLFAFEFVNIFRTVWDGIQNGMGACMVKENSKPLGDKDQKRACELRKNEVEVMLLTVLHASSLTTLNTIFKQYRTKKR